MAIIATRFKGKKMLAPMLFAGGMGRVGILKRKGYTDAKKERMR